MLPVNQAEQIILNLVQPFDRAYDVETLSLLNASGRILAETVTSSLDFPHWNNSAMDGYAVRYDDVQTCSAENPVILDIVEEIPAGYQPQTPIQPGQAARILTGSVMPTGADTIVIQEETQREGDRVTIFASPQHHAFVRDRGAFYQAGNALLPPGLRLQAPEIAVLAAAQCAQVNVYRRPKVAILSTGSELVGIDQPLQPGQIVDSNQYALAAVVAQAGAEPLMLGSVPDQPEALKTAIQQAIAAADMVLSSGGVSVGDYDYVDEILAALGATIHIHAVAVKPGKPLTVATFDHEKGRGKETPSLDSPTSKKQLLYFGLPGNPVSALVSCWRFVLPALRKLSGLPSPWEPKFVKARSLSTLKSDGKRESYLWGNLRLVDGEFEFELATGSHSSGNLINLAGTSGLAVIPLEETQISVGDHVQVLPIG
ncbi:molybdopterin molybdotransferase MoeA [Phormidium sp. CLA17]|uniref:molybdopterin molybdotransferase MoeA n=1 Tax=Leptolyngbya sp. Cla-17 TaxID=2803751 RepID=UPI00149183A6|nr:gephyrin-like molybdotransferase Glp [Leptolyngbya sp. Cla-17]MBM0743607.1 molybdopterin molybdotransferase MoeA [Leptolyngbya sp. Cla-17]